jgi:hypothetical protein
MYHKLKCIITNKFLNGKLIISPAITLHNTIPSKNLKFKSLINITMETTIHRTIKGSEMEAIFYHYNDVNIRSYEAIGIPNSEYDKTRKYKFEIRVRHNEGTDANIIFDKVKMAEKIADLLNKN